LATTEENTAVISSDLKCADGDCGVIQPSQFAARQGNAIETCSLSRIPLVIDRELLVVARVKSDDVTYHSLRIVQTHRREQLSVFELLNSKVPVP
jgi:hypothetical protein